MKIVNNFKTARIGFVIITVGAIWGILSFLLLNMTSNSLSYYQWLLTISFFTTLFYGDNYTVIFFIATLLNCILLSLLARYIYINFIKDKNKKVQRTIISFVIFIVGNIFVTFVFVVLVFDLFKVVQPMPPVEAESVQVEKGDH